jgi:hypothetical protein
MDYKSQSIATAELPQEPKLNQRYSVFNCLSSWGDKIRCGHLPSPARGCEIPRSWGGRGLAPPWDMG